VLLGGTIDRIDSKQDERGREVTRILDYKTGGHLKKTKSVNDLFTRDNKERDGYVFQAFYYSYLMKKEFDHIAPALLFMRNAYDETFEPYINMGEHPVKDFSIYHNQFEALLDKTIDEIFNSDVPYTDTTNKEACKYCKFTALCGRNKK
jgi:CRISPR/Cas system-associated exonuclease Cas4 (RecB family)